MAHHTPATSTSKFVLVQQTMVHSKVPGLRIDAQIPSLYGGQNQRVDQFNQAASELITQEITAVAGPMREHFPDSESNTTTSSSYISIEYEVVMATDRVASLLFTIHSYGAGAAHPNRYTQVLNYDLQRGEVLALADLFQPDSDALQVIADYCLNELRGRDIMIREEGAAATLENYKSWNLDDRGLRITFDPYQVASYAAGEQVVQVPYDELRALLVPNSIIRGFLSSSTSGPDNEHPSSPS